MGKLELQQMVLGPVYTNCYFLKNKETGETLIVDPADTRKYLVDAFELLYTKCAYTPGKNHGTKQKGEVYEEKIISYTLSLLYGSGTCSMRNRSDNG